MANILELRAENLPEKEATDLARWLSQRELATLTRIVESRIREHIAAAMGDAVKSADYPLKLEPANASLERVHRYNTFLLVLEEIKNAKSFTVNKWINP